MSTTPLLHAHCPHCESPVNWAFGEKDRYWCGSTDSFRSRECELREEIDRLLTRIRELEKQCSTSSSPSSPSSSRS